MIILETRYSKGLEIERIERTIFRLDWYLSNGYSLNWMSFPKKLDTNRIKELTNEEIRAAVDVEFDDGVYLAARDSLEQQFGVWAKALESFVSALGLSVISHIGVTLTRYGMGGSYSSPNNVIVNIARASGEGLIRCVLHETLHLHIEHLIQQYGLKQWEKEGLVELLFDHAFPELYQAQQSTSITEDTRKVFERLFPERSEMLVRG